MTAVDYLLVAAGGYVLALVLQGAGRALRDPAHRARRIAGGCLRVLAFATAAGTTIAWLLPLALLGGVLGGVFTFVLLFIAIPFIVIYTGQRVGEFRKRRGGKPVWHLLVLGAGGVVFLVPGVLLIAHGLLHTVGLTHEVEVRVTASHEGATWRGLGFRTSTFDGGYVLDGQTVRVTDSTWLSLDPLPSSGDVLPASVSPVWPHPVIEDGTAAGLLAVGGLVLVGLSVPFLYFATRHRSSWALR